MNRDESLRRAVALPPERHHRGVRSLLYPSEPGGGTWIGFNDLGLSLALINWHGVPTRAENRVVSRGTVVKALLEVDNIDQSHIALEGLPLPQMLPFRLVAIALRDRSIAEFRWDQDQLRIMKHPWVAQHWFSSGFDESSVQLKRSEICKLEWEKSDAGSLPWLRALHQSHLPTRGVFSICMHGKIAATVSYTELVLENNLGVMRYHQGPLCARPADMTERSIPLYLT